MIRSKNVAQLCAVAVMALGVAVPAHDAAHAQMAGERPELSPLSRVTTARSQAPDIEEGDRVFGGREAADGEYPFQVALLATYALDEDPVTQLDAQFCGGSLIAPDWVLTAAHCLYDSGQALAPDVVTVLSGATALNEGERHEVVEIIVHPDYNEANLDNDIGLMRLATPADQDLIRMTDADLEQGQARVTGWGLMENGGFPVNLMEVDIELQSNAACNDGLKQIYERDLGLILGQFAGRMRYSQEGISAATQAIVRTMNDALTGNMLCAGADEGVRDSCNGDSGGPLFTMQDGEPVQVGIVSWGDGPLDGGASCGHASAYGVYTRLANYRDWIAVHMGN